MYGKSVLAAAAILLVFASPAQARHESTLAGNPGLRQAYAEAVSYWGRSAVEASCATMRVEVRQPYLMGPDVWGEAPPHPPGHCEIWLRWGLGRCNRKLTLAHELGHELDLRFDPPYIDGAGEAEPWHSPDPSNIMYPYIWPVRSAHPEWCDERGWA
jgi:hypothetical protein